jgi:hypothetical protein
LGVDAMHFKGKKRMFQKSKEKKIEWQCLDFKIYIMQILVMFLHCDNPWILVAFRVVASQTFPGIIPWGTRISIPACSCQIVVCLDFFHVFYYNSKRQGKQRWMA